MVTTIGQGDYIYEYRPDWAKLPPGHTFEGPSGVAVDSYDQVYVYQRRGPAVLVFDREGHFLNPWLRQQWTDFKSPMGVHIDASQTVYVTDQVPRISVLSLDGELLARGRTFENAHQVCTDSRGDIYGVDTANQRVQKFVRV